MFNRKHTAGPRARLGLEPLLEDRTVPCGAECMTQPPSPVAALAAAEDGSAARAVGLFPAAPTAAQRAGSPALAPATPFLFPDAVVTRPERAPAPFAEPRDTPPVAAADFGDGSAERAAPFAESVAEPQEVLE